MSIKSSLTKVINAHDCVTELLVGLLGETSTFFTLNGEGTKIVAFKPNLELLPFSIALNIDLFTSLATNVRNLELWRSEFTNMDVIKRAHVESIFCYFTDYLNIVDELRMNHISGSAELLHTDLLVFVMDWHCRIQYILQVARNTQDMCGVDVMNDVYREWCLQCSSDWNFVLLENSLRQMSVAFHQLVCQWMLDGTLPPYWMQWMICDTAAAPNVQSSNTHAINMENLHLFNSSSSSNTTGKPSLHKSWHRLEIDWAHVPLAYSSSPEIIRKIFVVGRNLRLLREFRKQRMYEHRVDERIKLLEDEQLDKFKIWYGISERARFCAIVQKYANLIDQDIMSEIMSKQRLLDHISFVQTHFLLLHGDFSMGIYEAIRETVVGSGGSTQHLTTYKLDSMVMECVRYALNYTSVSHAFVDMQENLCAGDVTSATAVTATTQTTGVSSIASVMMADGVPSFEELRGSNSPLLESKATFSKTSSKKKSLQRALIKAAEGLFLEDLVRISYKASGLISTVLTPQVLRSYSCIFGSFIPWRILHCRANETALQFNNTVRLQRRSFLDIKSQVERREEFRLIRYVRLVIANVQRFTVSVLSYVFDEVFAEECPRSLANLRKQGEFPALVTCHNEFFSAISLALFVNRSSQSVFEALKQCLKTARRALRRVEFLREWIEKTVMYSIVAVDEASNNRSVTDDMWLQKRTHVEEVYGEFLSTTLRLRVAVADLLASEIKQSSHWRYFEPSSLLVPPMKFTACDSFVDSDLVQDDP